MGYSLENASYKALPSLLEKGFGASVIGRLKREYIEYEDGNDDQVNIYGKATKDGKEIMILGETKTHASKKEIKAFFKLIDRVKRFLKVEDAILLLVVHDLHPSVRRYAESLDLKVYYSYEFD